MKRIVRHISHACFISLLCLHTSLFHAGAMPPYGSGPGMMPNMSEADMFNMVEELEKEIAKLSPEERKNFDQMVESFGESLMGMSDDEFDRFISGQMGEDEIINRFGHIAPPAKQPETPEPQPEPQPEPEKPVIEVKPPSKEAVQAAAMLDDIIRHTESLMRKMPPDISFLLAHWLDTNALSHWSKTLEWATFEKDLEQFRAKLAQIRDDRDARRQAVVFRLFHRFLEWYRYHRPP